MAKKNFKGGFDSLLGNNKQANEIKTKSNEISVKYTGEEEEIRATFIINKNLLYNLKSIAYWDRLLIKDVLNKALNDYIDKYEIKNGEIKSIPEKK